MSDELDRSKLFFMIFPARFPQASYMEQYQKAYACWRSVWNQALKEEMNVKDDLYSDNYTRQSHVAVLFYDNEPACLTTLNYFDLNDPVALDDSYFKVWPELARAKIKKEARHIMTCCNVTVDFKFRRGALGFSWKDLMLTFLVRHLKSGPFDSVVAAVRLERAMDRAAYRTGAHPIHRNLPYTIEGQRIDLVCWHRNLDEKLIDPKIWELVNHVWIKSSKIIETTHIEQFDQGEKHVA